jgi:hypothetical protein
MTWYHLENKTFIYEGDLALLGLSTSDELPSEIVELTFTPKPVSDDPLVDYVIGDPIQVDGVWQTNWVEVVLEQDEYDAIMEAQRVRTEETLNYLKKIVPQGEV